MSHYSLDRKRAAVDVFRHVKRFKSGERAKYPSARELSSVAAGGASESQIYEWLQQDLSIDAQEHRAERRGSAPLLSQTQVSLLLGFACSLRSSLRPVFLNTLKQFCHSHLSKTPSLSTLSRIMTEHGFSSQKAMSRNSRMVDPMTLDDALSAIEEIRSYGYPPDQMLFMDETGLWSNVTAPRTYHFAGWYMISPLSFWATSLHTFNLSRDRYSFDFALFMSRFHSFPSFSSHRFSYLGTMRW